VIAAMWCADLLAQFVIARSPEPVSLIFEPDRRVLLYTLCVTAATTLLFGLVPAFRATSVEVLPALREDAPQTSGRSRMRSALIASQIALCTILLACATLFLRSLANARVIDPGFDPSGVVDVSLDLRSRNLSRDAGMAFYRQSLERTRSLPGVTHATFAALVPLGGSNMQTRMYVFGE